MTSKDPFKELTDGFLSPPELSDEGATTLRPTRHRVTLDRDRRSRPLDSSGQGRIPEGALAPPLALEILFPGNLPVWANLWLPEYARRIAANQGPVALVQLRYKTCSVQIFGGS